ncbi:MAG: SGNH/GDSL hydrolase family protein [Pseudomonadota bacterium]
MKKIASRIQKVVFAALSSCMITSYSIAATADVNKPLLVIGASYSDGRIPFNDALVAPLGGISVGLGSYLSLGDALIKNPRLPGYVINEAQAGATTFDRMSCTPGPACTFGSWQGYDKQLTKAIARVTVPGTQTILSKYVVITMANDCLHSDAFGVPQNQATQCTDSDMNAYVDRLIEVGRRATNLGLTPIYDIFPEYSSLDLPYAAQAFGFSWIIDKSSYSKLRDLHRTRIRAMLPNAVLLDIWANFEHGADGLHPTDKTSRKAAEIIAKYISHS